MALRQRYLKILSMIVPLGAFGASLLLGSVAPATAREDPARFQPRADGRPPVADRLAAIRQAVSEIAVGRGETTKDGQQLASWGNWRNGGGGAGAWRNGGGGAGAWRNGGGGAGAWRNGGWGGGGWRNGGPGWRNDGWRNGGWPNFWRNW